MAATALIISHELWRWRQSWCVKTPCTCILKTKFSVTFDLKLWLKQWFFFFFFRFLFFGCCVKRNLNMLIYWMEGSWETRDPYVGTGRGKIGTEKVVNSFGSWFQRDVKLFKFDAVWRKRAAVLYHVIFAFVRFPGSCCSLCSLNNLQ